MELSSNSVRKWAKVRGTHGGSVLFSIISYDNVITLVFLQSTKYMKCDIMAKQAEVQGSRGFVLDIDSGVHLSH